VIDETPDDPIELELTTIEVADLVRGLSVTVGYTDGDQTQWYRIERLHEDDDPDYE